MSQFILYKCDVCKRIYNSGYLLNNMVYKDNADKENEISFLLDEYLSKSDVCPECLNKVSNYVNSLEQKEIQ